MSHHSNEKKSPTFEVTDTRNNVTKPLADQSTRAVSKDDLRASALRKEQKIMQAVDAEARKILQAVNAEAQNTDQKMEVEFSRARFFLSVGHARGAASPIRNARIASDEVRPRLQEVVYGQENKVRDALEAIKDDPAKLSDWLSHTSTVTDYSNRTITGMTLLQAAAAAGDSDMCLMLKKYFDYIQNGQEEFSRQLTEIFPEGIKAHEKKQKQNCFNFDNIYRAIQTASLQDLEAALNNKKPKPKSKSKHDYEHENGHLKLYHALEDFRREFAEMSCSEKIFNPYHLLRAYRLCFVLSADFQTHNSGHERIKYFKRGELFLDQIIGYILRFAPSCYAQALAQRLDYLVKMNYRSESWCPEPFKRDFKIRNINNLSYFPLRDEKLHRLGFDFAIYQQDCGWQYEARERHLLQAFVSQKQQAFETMLSASPDDQCRSVVR